MVFDWTQPGTTDRVIEDIEREDFDFFEWHTNSVFAEWHDLQEYEWNTWRRAYVYTFRFILYRFL
jgi:hypothetical protein